MGNILNDLIRIKSSCQKDDLLKMLDEIPVYEKLSADEKLRDLKTSKITRTKCPMLAGFIDGNMYETVLADLAANVYLQIEGSIPQILNTATEKTLRQEKQMAILQTGIAHVEYRELVDYEHELMSNMLAAVFTKKEQSVTMAVLIVRTQNGYTMYHGSYSKNETNETNKNVYTPVIIRGEHGVLVMNSYSVLGNNGYPFATYTASNIAYDVMIGPDGILYLMNGGRAVITYPIPHEDHNKLNMFKKDAQEFAKIVTEIIESVVQ